MHSKTIAAIAVLLLVTKIIFSLRDGLTNAPRPPAPRQLDLQEAVDRDVERLQRF